MAARPRPVKRPSRKQLVRLVNGLTAVVKLLAVVSALIVVIIGVHSLRVARHPPAAEAFTRVGGRTSVETAVDAARFWLSPPKTVVEVPVNAKPASMLKAAQCAIRNGAPLLYVTPSWKPLLPDRPTIEYWPHASIVRFGMTACPRGDSRAPDITLLDVPAQQPLTHLLPRVPAPGKLAPFVVFAAAFTPGHLPDVAVGLALAAHLASTRHAQVSLVVVQPYLEADPVLESQLQNQPTAVTGGVVLGETATVPQDTVALLRHLLRVPSQPSLLAQIRTNLQKIGALLTALLALVGAGAVAQAAEPAVMQLRKALGKDPPPSSDDIRTRRIQTDGIVTTESPPPGRLDSPAPRRWRFPVAIWSSPTPWRKAFGSKESLSVTCWLRSGLAVTGTFDDKNTPAGAKLWKIGAPELLGVPGEAGRQWVQPSTKLEYLLVPVEDIMLAGVNKAAGGDKESGDE